MKYKHEVETIQSDQIKSHSIPPFYYQIARRNGRGQKSN